METSRHGYDGLTAQMPEYSVLRYLGLRSDEQSLVETGGHSYDVLTASDIQTHQKVTLLFNVDRPMAKLDAMMKERQ